ncbi:protein SCO1/2 [Chitinophaga costaii]|uniref:Protein SCO1/2 n=1 Tax=Chitinophaga costaii TaxID=1335309 RepID=A0A1C4B0X0_9BACT|nr:SCO family protein [Chitinophaga costaii]PUZ26830.1 SCO family protein [Chitinophaga costaii]SCC00545.1 protein SCO1/2 [Chitinophaga costaii]
MSKRGILGFALATLVPLAGYLIVDHYGRGAVPIPHYYIPDSVQTIEKDGKTVSDTIFHVVKDFTLTNQLGHPTRLSDFPGKVILADFFFTSCPGICPTLTTHLKRIQEAYVKNDTLLQILSFSIDPERDSVPRLLQYAAKYQINPDNWSLLTGDKPTIYNLARNEFLVPVQKGDGGPDDFIHTEKFVLLDKYHHIRGYYNGLDTNDLRRLANDISVLHLVKDRNQPGLLKRLFSAGNQPGKE